ncbi:hypothetical protein ACFQ6N_04100 [Kitasatospora sp. NPDC056446]|uniref:hypothetical protein n=1 Tax=Kitasatospora sp. NPDC056446 TaxID=3345819 RepID=UPI0036B83FE1
METHRSHRASAPAPEPAPEPVLEVNGGKRLSGSVRTSGFKHSLVTTAAAAAAARATVTIDNCPDIVETEVLSRLFRTLGGSADLADGTLTLDASSLGGSELPAELVGMIHGSMYLLPGLVARAGSVRMPASGGCPIGEGPHGRPVGHILSVMERFGAVGRVAPDGAIEVTATALTGCTIDLLDYTRNRAMMSGPLYGGATKTALLTGAVAQGTTTLHHLYPKPDVTDLIAALRDLGAELEHTGPETLVIHGRGAGALRQDVRRTLIPDLIEVVTWICAAVTLGDSPVHIAGPEMLRAVEALRPEFDLFDRMGVRVDIGEDGLTAHPAEGPLRPVEFTAASRGVFSDSQPFLALMAAYAQGPTTITEGVWEHRFGYVPGLAALGMRTTQDGHVLRVDGPCPPATAGLDLHATDLRAAAALLLAALAVPGTTVLRNHQHLDRGYRDITGDLRTLGADIRRTTLAPRPH